MSDDKARRAFTNFVIEQIGYYETVGEDNYCADICECWRECKCAGECGSEQCVDQLIDYYGGEDYADN